MLLCGITGLLHAVTLHVVSGQIFMLLYSHTDHMKSFISLWEYSLDCQRKFLDISITLFSFDIFVRALTLYEF